ncbi:MAG: DNA recombination protein RmuC [PVC group bacterium]|nr:DNA recombination protein RmuC [PVC group bacterium]
MESILIVLLFIVIVAVVLLYLKLQQKRTKGDALGLMQQQMDSMRQQVNQQLGDLNNSINQNLQAVTKQMLSSQQTVGDRLDSATRVVGQVQKDLVSLSEATQRVFEVGKDISGLQDILKAPKLRGGLGELFLEDILRQILPTANFDLQYKFKNGDTVDAIIRLGQGLVSVDSKFPLENFCRIMSGTSEEEKQKARRTFKSDVKKHIDSIAEKYIVPDEGTFDFALMYIMAENVYYEMIIKEDSDSERSLSAYALTKKVIPVSPNSFYAYLQAIVLGLKGLRVEKNVEEIIRYLSRLSSDMQHFRKDFDVIGRHIVNIKNKYDEADKKIVNFEEKLLTVCSVDKQDNLLGDNDEK